MPIIDIASDVLSGVDKTQQRSWWDTVTITSGSSTISAGTSADVFTDVSSKTIRNSNLTTNGMFPIQFSAVIYRIRFETPTNIVPSNLQAIAQNGTFQLFRNQNELVYEETLSSIGQISSINGVSEDGLTGTTHAYGFGPGNSLQVPALSEFGQIAITAGMSYRGVVSFSDAVSLTSLTSFELRFFLDTKLFKPVA
jgi:lipopolysaccharide export system protein LptA